MDQIDDTSLPAPELTVEAQVSDYNYIARRAVFSAREHIPVDIPIDKLIVNEQLDIYPAVTSRDYFQIYLKDKKIVFQAGSYVGLIPINDRVAIDVSPRVPIRDGNLEYIIRLADHTPRLLEPYTRAYKASDESTPSLLDFLTKSFLASLEEIELHGLYRVYQQKITDTSFPRGRILMGDTFQRYVAHGNRHRVTASWFEQSLDNAPNQCIKYTIWYLVQRYSRINPRQGTVQLIRQLNRLYNLFHNVTLDRSRSFLDHPSVKDPTNIPANRAYYRHSLYLAETIIRDRGIEFGDQTDKIIMASFLVNMETVFENYLRNALRLALGKIRPDIQVLDGNKKGSGGAQKPLFDPGFPKDQGTNEAKPDIVLGYFPPGSDRIGYPIIFDAKYKVEKGVPEREDLNQAIAYGISYRSSCVILLNPKIEDRRQGLQPIGHIGSLEVYQYLFDLAALNLEEEERNFASAIAGLLDPPPSQL